MQRKKDRHDTLINIINKKERNGRQKKERASSLPLMREIVRLPRKLRCFSVDWCENVRVGRTRLTNKVRFTVKHYKIAYLEDVGIICYSQNHKKLPED